MWIGILVAVLVVGALAIYTATSGGRAPAASTGSSGLGTFALPAEPQAQPAQAAPAMSAGTVAGLVVKVGIVAVIMGVSLWLLRRYAGTNASRGGGRTGAVSIADTITLAQGKAVYVLDLGDRALVVGATTQQLSLLAEMTDPNALAKLRTTPERPPSPLTGLSQRFGAALQGFNAMQQARVAPSAAAATASLDEVLVAGTPATPRIRPSRAASFSETLATFDQPTEVSRRAVDDEPLPGERLAELAAKLRAMRSPA
ncbi:MAG: flagellar biosynthetic protein FliO [Chloroflexi bacterium]|nr:flagellar biosynthetic protein FliO [Chloroflexota bacterium]